MEEKKKKSAAKKAGLTVKAKKKTAVARAVVKKGTGKIKINKKTIDSTYTGYLRSFVEEPVKLAEEAAQKLDIFVKVKGSGTMSQAVAVRACIAKGIVAGSKNSKIKELFLRYDRLMLVDDTRRVESKKTIRII